MRPQDVNEWISEARFQNYLDASGGDHNRAVAIYSWNAQISSAFLEVLHHVEVLLRNAVDRQFPVTDPETPMAIWSDAAWLTDSAYLGPQGRERVNEAIQRLTLSERTETRARVVASLSFGFWAALFTGRYDDLWRTHLRHAFPNGDGRRKQINKLVQRINRVRNRVAHHEAIFDFDLTREHDKQLELAALIDIDARKYIAGQSRVRRVLKVDPRLGWRHPVARLLA